MDDPQMNHAEPVAGQLASFEDNAADHPHLVREPHCEICGRVTARIIEGHTLVGFLCPEHGRLEADETIWVWHERRTT